jgi:ubiquinone/menaquinone biosynthesis C-methylase UbiE
MSEQPSVQEQVKEYYGEILKSSDDLQTNACCTDETIPTHVKEILKQVEDEVMARFYGCGSPIPDALEGCTVLDLGCGTGRDSFVLSKLVGETGEVIGVDMTDEQLNVARQYQDAQAKTFGFSKPNTRFLKGYIEDLQSIDIPDNSVDLIVSNCVINLSPRKEDVFREIFRVLKPGGELYFSDIFADRRIPDALRSDPVLHGECLAGAMYTHDFRRLLRKLGCMDYRVVTQRRITIDNHEIEARIGMVNFQSITIRAFKLDLEDICEDYGQVATYKGTIPFAPHSFALDDHHLFETHRPMRVCSNTAAMLQDTRFAPHFDIIGDLNTHFGEFDCSPSTNNPSSATNTEEPPSAGCC